MTIINIRNADGFTLADNFYAIPKEMGVDTAQRAIRFCISGAAGWSELDAELATMGIVPVRIHTVDVEF